MERMTLSTFATVSTGGFRTLEPQEKGRRDFGEIAVSGGAPPRRSAVREANNGLSATYTKAAQTHTRRRARRA